MPAGWQVAATLTSVRQAFDSVPLTARDTSYLGARHADTMAIFSRPYKFTLVWISTRLRHRRDVEDHGGGGCGRDESERSLLRCVDMPTKAQVQSRAL